MAKKKRIGSSGRFGPRYGKRIRAKISEIDRVQKQRHTCPSCDMPYVRRISAGIWFCEKCHTKFSGAAYSPKAEMIKKEKVEMEEE